MEVLEVIAACRDEEPIPRLERNPAHGFARHEEPCVFEPVFARMLGSACQSRFNLVIRPEGKRAALVAYPRSLQGGRHDAGPLVVLNRINGRLGLGDRRERLLATGHYQAACRQ